LARELLAHGYTVHGVGLHLDPGPTLAGLAVHYTTLDLLDRDAVSALVAGLKPDVVIHLAALASPSQSWHDPLGTLTVNAGAQLALFDAIRSAEIDPAIVVVGSGEVYGAAAAVPTPEDAPFQPRNPYAVSKVAQDALAFQYHVAHGLRTIRLRPYNHIGPGQSDGYAIASFARQIAEAEAGRREPVMHVGNLAAQRDFTDVRDVVRAYRLAAEHGVAGEAYNVGSGVPRSVRAMLDGLLERARCRLRVEVDPARFQPLDTPVVACDAARLRAATGWRPDIPLAQTLDDILDDWRQRVRDA
jgi:GDP-4-dehydro-6-deoxy-D-mannose reductase